MHFTKTQQRAILFVVAVFTVVLVYHILNQLLNPVTPYDFSQFNEKFEARRDSILMILEQDALSQNPRDSLSPGISSVTASAQNQLININSASLDELTKLPRIGPVTAQRIIEHRSRNGRFLKKEDIQNVKGIGEKTYENLRNLITVE